MKRKDDLFRLIQSMSKSEKRYFTLDAQKTGKTDAKYLELFKAISNMDKYEEITLKRLSNHLSVDKAYLYEAILRSMRDYHSKKSRSAQIKEKLIDAKYLFERELYELCQERLDEATVLAKEIGDHLSLLMINREERRIAYRTRKGDVPVQITHLLSTKEDNILALSEENNYLDLLDKLWKNSFTKEALPDSEVKLLHSNPSTFHSMLSTHRFFQCNGLYYQQINNNDRVFEYFDKAMGWWDEYPKYKEEEFYNYIIDASNFLAICFKKERFDYFNELLTKLESENPINSHHQKILFQRLFQFKLLYNINFGIVTDVLQIAETVEDGLNKHTVAITTEKVLSFNIAVLLFIAGEHQQTVLWCDRVIKSKGDKEKLDTTVGSYFLKILTTIELDDLDTMESAFRSAYRFLAKTDIVEKPYFIGFWKKLKEISELPYSDFVPALAEIKIYINTMRNSIAGRIPWSGFDEMTVCWIDSKQTKKSISQVIQETKN